MDQGTKTISRVNFEGRHRKTAVESNGYLDQPFGLAVFEVRRRHSTVEVDCLETCRRFYDVIDTLNIAVPRNGTGSVAAAILTPAKEDLPVTRV